MHLTVKDEDNFVVFVPVDKMKNINFDKKSELEEYFKNIFCKLQKKIEIKGCYLIDIYIDDIYGLIIDIKKEEIEFFDYFDNSIDMQISKPQKIRFIYQLNDLLLINQNILKKVYFYKNKYYVELKNNIEKKDLILFLELVDDIVFSKKDDIIRCAKKLKEV